MNAIIQKFKDTKNWMNKNVLLYQIYSHLYNGPPTVQMSRGRVTVMKPYLEDRAKLKEKLIKLNFTEKVIDNLFERLEKSIVAEGDDFYLLMEGLGKRIEQAQEQQKQQGGGKKNIKKLPATKKSPKVKSPKRKSKKRSTKRKSPKVKSPKRKSKKRSTKRKSPKVKSPKRKSKKRSTKRKSPKVKSPKRKSKKRSTKRKSPKVK